MQQTLRGFTIDAAWASFQESRVGSLEAGKEADFVILDADLFKSRVEDISSIRSVATIVGGQLAAGRLDL